MVGQCLGAGKPERAEQAVWIAARYNMALLGGVGLLFLMLAPGRSSASSATIPRCSPVGVQALRTMSLGFAFFGLGMVLTQSFNGAGDTWTPTLDQPRLLLALADPAGATSCP